MMYEFKKQTPDGTVYNYGGRKSYNAAKKELRTVFNCLKHRELWTISPDGMMLNCNDGTILFMGECK